MRARSVGLPPPHSESGRASSRRVQGVEVDRQDEHAVEQVEEPRRVARTAAEEGRRFGRVL